MKKKDIINLIKAKETIYKNEDLISIIKNQYYYIDEKYWFPDILELQKYFDILKEELKQAKKETDEALALIRNSQCTHDVRLDYNSLYNCVLCGKNIHSNNYHIFKESIYRNRYSVIFKSKYQWDEDYKYEIENGKTEQEVWNMIFEILKKYNDEDDVDLVLEFSKLNLENVTINLEKRKKENYILIISGSNKEFINENLYITKQVNLDCTDFFNFFNSLLNTRIAVIDNNFSYKGQDYDENYVTNYSSISSLEHSLSWLKDVPFKLIIDLSNIYDYEIINNKIVTKNHDLNLEKLFPNSYIIKITNFNITDLKLIKEFLLKYNQKNKISIININKNYYYLDDNNLQNKDLDSTCNYVKKLIKKI